MTPSNFYMGILIYYGSFTKSDGGSPNHTGENLECSTLNHTAYGISHPDKNTRLPLTNMTLFIHKT